METNMTTRRFIQISNTDSPEAIMQLIEMAMECLGHKIAIKPDGLEHSGFKVFQIENS